MVAAQWDNLRTWNNETALIRSDTVTAVLYSKITVSTGCSAAGKAEIFCICHLLPVPREKFIKILLLLQTHRMKILVTKVFYLSHYCITPGCSAEHLFLLFKKFLCCCRAESIARKWTIFFFHYHEQQQHTTGSLLCLFGHCYRSKDKEEQDITWILNALTRTCMLAWHLRWMPLPHKVALLHLHSRQFRSA